MDNMRRLGLSVGELQGQFNNRSAKPNPLPPPTINPLPSSPPCSFSRCFSNDNRRVHHHVDSADRGHADQTLFLTIVTHGPCWGFHTERDTLRRISHWSLRSHSLSLSQADQTGAGRIEQDRDRLVRHRLGLACPTACAPPWPCVCVCSIACVAKTTPLPRVFHCLRGYGWKDAAFA